MLTRKGLFAVLLMLAFASEADIYRSQDSYGNTVFSDKPTTDADRVELDTRYRYKVKVKKVIDGDTLLLEDGEKVRLIGINTPEIQSRFSQTQPGGEAARDWLLKTLRSPHVLVQYDVEQFDKYDRRLAHVFLETGEYLNAMLLEQGLAMLTLTPPNLFTAESLVQAQRKAEQHKKGIWQMPAYQRQPMKRFDATQQYAGWQRWEVIPTRQFESRKYQNLLVTDSLIISIPKAQLDLFPPLETYLNKRLEVRGWLRKQGQQQRFYVRHPSALIQLD